MIFEGKRIVVTGGTGSMGKTFVHRVLSGERGTPRKVIVFSRDEAKQHSMRMAYLHKQATTDEVIFRNFMNVLEFRIGDVREHRHQSRDDEAYPHRSMFHPCFRRQRRRGFEAEGRCHAPSCSFGPSIDSALLKKIVVLNPRNFAYRCHV